MTADLSKSPYKITLYLDTPQPMLAPWVDPKKHLGCDSTAITGHAYIGLSDGDNEERWGYGPDGGTLIEAVTGVKGCFVPEDHYTPHNEAIVWRISKHQYDAAREMVEDLRKNPGMYKLFEKNCSTVATAILQAANVPDAPKGAIGMTPFGLALKKRVMLAKRRAEMVKFHVKNAVRSLFGKKKAPTSELLDSLRSKPIPVSIRTATKNSHNEKAVCKTRSPNIDQLVSKLAMTR